MNRKSSLKVDDWVPFQHATPLGLRKKVDFHVQHCVKYPGEGEFHSREELYYAMLREADTKTSSYVPRPFRFRVGSRWYIPDCFYVRGERRVLCELKASGAFEPDWRSDFENYLRRQRIEFEVISNESVRQQEFLAENWLTIVQVLVRGKPFDTEQQEQEILDHALRADGNYFGTLMTLEALRNTPNKDLALFRLLHRGVVNAKLDEQPLSYDTWIEPCF